MEGSKSAVLCSPPSPCSPCSPFRHSPPSHASSHNQRHQRGRTAAGAEAEGLLQRAQGQTLQAQQVCARITQQSGVYADIHSLCVQSMRSLSVSSAQLCSPHLSFAEHANLSFPKAEENKVRRGPSLPVVPHLKLAMYVRGAWKEVPSA